MANRSYSVTAVRNFSVTNAFRLIPIISACKPSLACKSGGTLKLNFPEKVFSGFSPLSLHQVR